MRAWVITLTLTVMLTKSGAAQIDKTKLRNAATLPTVVTAAGYEFSSTHGFKTSAEKSDISAEIPALRKAMRGDTSDAERHYRLGRLYAEAQDRPRAQEAFVKSVALFRQQVKARPRDARLLARLGEALGATGKDGEAEAVLRQAVTIAPREWRGWIALAHLLSGRAVAVLWGDAAGGWKPGDAVDYQRLEQQVARERPSVQQIERAKALLEEARRAHDRAVASTPRDPQPYLERGWFRAYVKGFLESIFFTAREERTDVAGVTREARAKLAMGILAPEALADFRQMARLSPNTPRALALATMFEITAAIAANGQQRDVVPGGGKKALPEAAQRPLRKALVQLRQLARSKNVRTASEAAEAEGYFEFIHGDPTHAETCLRRALALDPRNEQAWNVLTGVLVGGQRYGALVSLYQERLKRNDTAQNRLILAKAYERLNRLDKAEEQVQAALKREPDDFLANLALAVLWLKRSDDEVVFQKAKVQFARVTQVLSGREPRHQLIDYALMRGIFLALNGDLGEARRQLIDVLEADKDNTEAKEALTALGEPDTRTKL